MESQQTLRQALSEVEQWENDQKDLWFWEKLGRLPFVFLDRITPTFVHEKLGQAIDELSTYVDTGGRYLINEKDILKRFTSPEQTRTGSRAVATEIPTLTEVSRMPLTQMNQVADNLRDAHKSFATVQGATTGFGGIFTLVIDIPMLLGQSLKVLQEMALAYGYDPRDKQERIFIIKCLQYSSADIVGKRSIIEELTTYQQASSKTQTVTQLQGWREVIMTYRDNYGWKKLFQLVPVAGMLFGAYLNRKTIEEVAEAGMMLYRKRRILQRLAEGE
ncbi:EcsC family protein [Brevibacillus dissolubilis]|uniref:EcsC family protein n=1 Tax=Brevibacillus dissolubilis TaxID=1844116 RepID=UPI001116BF71|nr:EcsC family protein [Brevibacillus dissolubilis]